jgi:hypothetical protein
LAIVKVLPDPVTPEQHLRLLAALDLLDQLGDRGRLVAGRLVFRHDPEGPAAFRLFRPLGPMRDEFRAGFGFLEAGSDCDRHDLHMAFRSPSR